MTELDPTTPIGPGADVAGDAGAAAPAIRDQVRAELDRARAELGELRRARDEMNDRIRARVAEVDTLAAACALFDRRARAEADAARPVRRGKGGTS